MKDKKEATAASRVLVIVAMVWVVASIGGLLLFLVREWGKMPLSNVVFLGLGAFFLLFVWITYLFNPFGWEFARRGREVELRNKKMRNMVEAIRAAGSIGEAVKTAEKAIWGKR